MTTSNIEAHSFLLFQPTVDEVSAEGTLHFTEAIHGKDIVTIRLEDDEEIPVGSTVQAVIYDGPNCRSLNGSAKDISASPDYVTAGLFSAEVSRESEKPKFGVFLSWTPTNVQASPLYKAWEIAPTQKGTRPNGYGTMDLCVGVAVKDPTGKEMSYSETYVMTTWDNESLLNVYTVPLTKEKR